VNILVTTDAFPPGAGGSGRSTSMLAEALAERGHRVRVVVARSRDTRESGTKPIEVIGVEVPPSRPGNAPEREKAFASGLARAAEDARWDVVHAQHWLSAGATRRALPHHPLVITVRDYWPVCIWSTRLSGREACPGCTYGRRVLCVGRRKPWLWPIAPLLPPVVGAEIARRQRVLGEAGAMVAVSRFVAETLPVDAEVIPNLLTAFPEPPRPDDVPERYVLFVGKLEPGKAPDHLLPILEASGSDLPLLIAGAGRLEGELRAASERRGNVRFLGWVDEPRVLALSRHASCLLFPSRWEEPLSRTLLDGLSVGAVIVAEPTGGTEEILVDGESGLLGRTVPELGRALARVLEDDSLAERLRRGARARAQACFSADVVLPRVEALYRKVAGS
jgi:glycogen(starch) synthase